MSPPVREAVDPWAPPASVDAKRSWGPLAEGLSVPRDLDLGDRAKALEQLGVKPLAHATIVGVVKDALPETQVGLLVGSRQWPLLAARMDQIRDQAAPHSWARTWPVSRPIPPGRTGRPPPRSGVSWTRPCAP
ncbi:hypothetical protein [Streptomyces goshikiensis]|uniref:hypothetical protein n=1 Tax=Streptomyces goshikiensis TaxID=1942 RepID=UPI0036B61121